MKKETLNISKKDNKRLSVLSKRSTEDVKADTNQRLVFGRALRDKIERSGMTQADVCRLVGCNQQSLYKYINGLRMPRPRAVLALASALGVTYDDLMEPVWSLQRGKAGDYVGALKVLHLSPKTMLNMVQIGDDTYRIQLDQTVTLDQAMRIYAVLKKD